MLLNPIKTLLLLLLSVTSAFAQNESLNIYHVTGNYTDPPFFTTFFFNLFGSQTYLNTGSAYAEFQLSPVDPIPIVDTRLSGIAIPILSAITASTSLQTVTVSSTAGMTLYAVVDAGTTSQEVISASIVDSTHLQGIFRRNHTTSSTIRPVYFTISRFILKSLQIPTGWAYSSVTNIDIVRSANLPANVYDQYTLRAASGSAPGCVYLEDPPLPWTSDASAGPYDPVPQFDAGSLSSTGNPTNGISIAAGPISSTGTITPCIQVQLLYTSVDRPGTPVGPYRVYWDRNP